jgi:hypothetical protein
MVVRGLYAFSLVLMLSQLACAQNYPTLGQVFNKRENNFIEYLCSQDGRILDCKLTQVSVRKKLNDIDAATALQNAKREFEQDTPKFTSDMLKNCKEYRDWDGAMSGGKSNKETLEKYKSATEGKSARELADSKQAVALAVHFCDEPTLENWLAIVSKTQSIEKRKCLVTVNPFHQRFSQVVNLDVWTVVQEEGATGSCGIINVSRFEKDKNTKFPFWNYFAKKVVTNQNGEMVPGLKCSALDESEYEYNWQSEVKYLGCEFIKFGEF